MEHVGTKNSLEFVTNCDKNDLLRRFNLNSIHLSDCNLNAIDFIHCPASVSTSRDLNRSRCWNLRLWRSFFILTEETNGVLKRGTETTFTESDANEVQRAS